MIHKYWSAGGSKENYDDDFVEESRETLINMLIQHKIKPYQVYVRFFPDGNSGSLDLDTNNGNLLLEFFEDDEMMFSADN
ncbi:MAG: hypothetical protein COV44_02095 [Deltaproteobacteria bacterium CG11_big_fil_rev_8_21_14_0_20_45_16]|nr:MAG: hypothetical protein COV44_02095 [Deltaproteobacteria bacterium CG11_big_fil_rev_8_21_14_0_20_45_16]